ncbi:MAG TPA: phosphodiesterase, partial [Allosphingosinicella sp.]|nr:phosphodiesterase [Allosphingosinicella sp.]
MLIAQITDIHLGFEPGNPDELNRRRLDSALRTL